MKLCQNRPEGFGPHSQLHPTLPTTCFADTILIPLSTWLYLPVLLILILLHVSSRSPSSSAFFKPTASAAGPPRTRRSRSRCCVRTASVLYSLLILALLAMLSLELARLSLAKLGLGLLPFNYVGILAAGLVRWAGGSNWVVNKGGSERWRRLRWAGVWFWLLLAVTYAVGMASLIEEHGVDEKVRVKYPTIDEWTDRAVIVGVALVQAGLEGVGAREGGWRDH